MLKSNHIGDISVEQNLADLKDRIATVQDLLRQIRDSVSNGRGLAKVGESNITQAEETIQRCREALRVSYFYIHFLFVG